MIIDSNIKPFVVSSDVSIREALGKISENESKFVLLVSPKGHLEGVLTDGDVRRWLVRQKKVDTDMGVSEIMSKEFCSTSLDASQAKIQSLFSRKIQFIPLLDRFGHLVAIARPRDATLKIGPFELHQGSPALLIAEVGINHNGDIALAKRLVDEAVAAGADCVKFQMRDLDSLHRNRGKADDMSADLGDQYTMDLLTRFQLTPEEYFEVFDYVKQKGAFPLCTPFDERSVDRLEEYGIGAYKIASADLTNHPLLEKLAKTRKPLLCSTGMSVEDEVRSAVSIFRNNGVQYVLLHCNSTYPAPLKDVNLNYLDRLREIGGSLVGYSGHELGFSAALGAIGKGAKVIEKHFTLDKSMEGNDHRVSLLPGEFRQMAVLIREIEQALGSGGERTITQGERMNREVLGKSLIINTDLAEGQTIEAHMIDVKSPGQGLPPYRKNELVGRRARRPFKAGDFFFPQDILGGNPTVREYHFDRPFGIPVRFHDFAAMLKQSNFDLVEFHLSYKDLDVPIEEHLSGTYPVEYTVHAPDLFANDHMADLCSFDEAFLQRSLAEVQRVIDMARRLKRYFPRTKIPRIIINGGGVSERGHIPPQDRAPLYKQLSNSLAKLDRKGVELIPQTMPPFPWYFGGQRYHSLFVEPHEIAAFCKSESMRICLDVSHVQMSANYYKWSLPDFIEIVGPYIAHVHIGDASGVDGEGLQIGEGDMDFVGLAAALRQHAPHASFIPEIWQGHKNGGEGFWVALDRLESYFGVIPSRHAVQHEQKTGTHSRGGGVHAAVRDA